MVEELHGLDVLLFLIGSAALLLVIFIFVGIVIEDTEKPNRGKKIEHKRL